MAQETSKGKSGLAIPARAVDAPDGKRASFNFRSGDSMRFSIRSRIVGKNEAACAADAAREVVERWLPNG
jgi:hypothetical protein